MPFYFAWVGGDPLPPFTLNTTGDVWGGSFTLLGSTWAGELRTTGDIFTTGIFLQRGPRIENLDRIDGLVVGRSYLVEGPSFTTPGEITNQFSPAGGSTFTYEGNYAGTIDPPANIAEGLAITLRNTTDLNIAVLNPGQPDLALLVIGRTYRISGSGIPDNTFFTWDGSLSIEMTNNAISNGFNTQFTISYDLASNIISNLANTTGLIIGQDYRVFGHGIPASAIGRFQSDGTLFLSQPATETTRQTFLTIHRGIVYPDGGDFDPVAHARFDEQVLSLSIEQSEGNFAQLTIELKNPEIGLLAPGRNVWCWLSWQETDDSEIIPLFHGRLVAVPADLEAEKITLQFHARPRDYDNQQAIQAVDLRVAPFYDRPWLQNGIDDPTTLLEARTALWHVDRTTLDVTISDITVGEDGTLDVAENEHLYENLNVQYGSPPLSGIYLTATVSWDQEDTKEIDLTKRLVDEFVKGGSPFPAPVIGVHCGDGLFSSWPKPETSIGGGWRVGPTSKIIRPAFYYKITTQNTFVSRYSTGEFPIVQVEQTSFPSTGIANYGIPQDSVFALANIWEPFQLFFPVDAFQINFTVAYTAKRSWKETVSFFLEADTQELVTDNISNIETLSLNSSIIDQPIDPGGLMPLRDKRDNSYFKSARGKQSFEFLLSYAKAKLVARARAVTVSFVVPWKKAIGLTCRWNAHITDRRLPGGHATGKVISYKLEMSAQVGMKASVSIGCTIGRGGANEAVDGTPDYVDNGYVDPGYQTTFGAMIDIGDGSVAYQSLDDFRVIDDGVNLHNMTPSKIIKRLKIIGNFRDQLKAIGTMKEQQQNPILQQIAQGQRDLAFRSNIIPSQVPDPTAVLKDMYPRVILELQSVAGGGFVSTFPVRTTPLQIAKTIDLEAAS